MLFSTNVNSTLRVQGEPPNCVGFLLDCQEAICTAEYFDCCGVQQTLELTPSDPNPTICANVNAPYTNNGFRFIKNPGTCDC